MSAGSFIRNVPLSPAVTGAILYALTKAPETYRQPLLAKLGEYLSAKTIERAITTLKWLCALGVARNLHIWLSNIAQNNFRLGSEKHRYNWPNEVAVVTGAAGGFGSLISKGLAAKGVNVMAVDVASELPEDMRVNPRIQYYQCDITDRTKVIELAERIRKQYGAPSILVNNAGIFYKHSILDASPEALKNLFDINVISHYWTLQAFMPAMIANKKGHVVTMASMASFTSVPGQTPYSNTKTAVLSLHEGLQQETRVLHNAPEIKFTSIHPTFARTAMTMPFRQELADKKAVVIAPEDVSNAVVNQILSGTGRQIVLAPGHEIIAGIRSWPHWLAGAVKHAFDKSFDNVELGKEIRGG